VAERPDGNATQVSAGAWAMSEVCQNHPCTVDLAARPNALRHSLEVVMDQWLRFRRLLPALFAVGLLTLSMVIVPSASAATRIRLMVRVSEAGVWTVPGYSPYAKLIKTKHYGECVVAIAESRRSVEGRLWLEVETASSPSGSGWIREDLLGRYADRC
jgi:hypothetical protein